MPRYTTLNPYVEAIRRKKKRVYIARFMGSGAYEEEEAWSPSALFASSEVGVWYDPSDLSTMWTDDGTTPAAVGDRVYRIDDKSGNGFHARQTTEGFRPILRNADGLYYLEFAGTDDFLTTANIDFTSSDKMAVFTGFVSTDNLSFDGLFSVAAVAAGGFWAYTNTINMAVFAQGASAQSTLAIAYTPATKSVFSGFANLSGATGIECLNIRKNGGILGSSSVVAGTRNFTTGPIIFGRSGSVYLTGNIYSFIAVAAEIPHSNIINSEKYVGGKSGVTVHPALTPAVAVGDSVISVYSGSVDIFAGITSSYTEQNLADPGDTIDQQKTVWITNSPSMGQPAWVGVQVGLNDLVPAEAASVAIARLQLLIDTIRTDKGSGTKILIGQLTPCKASLINSYGAIDGETAYQKWLSINEAIGGGGATPITGVDAIATAHVAALNDGSGNLAAAYAADLIHPNNAGRQIISDSWVAALTAAGITV